MSCAWTVPFPTNPTLPVSNRIRLSCLLSSATQFRSNQIAIRRSEFIAIDHSEVHAISHSETGHFSIVMTAEFPIALTSERLFSSARNDYFHASESARIIDWACTLAESQWLAPRERMALFNNSDSPRQLGEEGDR